MCFKVAKRLLLHKSKERGHGHTLNFNSIALKGITGGKTKGAF